MLLIKSFIALAFLFGIYETNANAFEQKLSSDVIPLYDQGEFEALSKILEDKVNNNQPDIDAFDFFALGNAYFKQGLNGKAMAAYLKASELAPRSSVIAFNLKKVSDQSRDKLGYDWPEAQWKKALVLYRKLSVQELFYLGAMLIALAGIFICAYLFSSQYKRLFITLCFICFGFGGYAATVFFFSKSIWPKWGAVTSFQTNVYSSPSAESGVVLFKLNDGAPVMIEGSDGLWSKIGLSDGKRGWVETDRLASYYR